jgi:hypothetical protein
MRFGPGANDRVYLLDRRRAAKTAEPHLDPTVDWVGVPVLESGQEHAVAEVDDLRLRSDPAAGATVAPYIDDSPSTNRDGGSPATSGIDRVDGAMAEHEVGG